MDESSHATSPRVVVSYANESDASRRRAIELARRLALPVSEPTELPPDTLRLIVTDTRLELRGSVDTNERPFYVDFLGGSARARRVTPHAGKELIARAVGLKGDPLFIVDATAGFARDAFVLARLGCRVHAIERSPIVAALVEDGVARARAVHQPKINAALERLHFEHGDAGTLLAWAQRPADCPPYAGGSEVPMSTVPDVVYLDPMYPASRRSALNRKELRMLRALVGDDDDASALLAVARRVAARRVVVKRPLHAPPLAPDSDIHYKGSSVRFDVYLTPARQS